MKKGDVVVMVMVREMVVVGVGLGKKKMKKSGFSYLPLVVCRGKLDILPSFNGEI